MSRVEVEVTPVLNEVVQEIIDALQSIQFGSVEIQIHNGAVVQLERREKKRWDKRSKPSVEIVSGETTLQKIVNNKTFSAESA